MTATAAVALRRLDRAEVQPFLAQLSEWLLPGAAYDVQHTWPQLYRSDGSGDFLGLFDGERLLSHCAYKLVTVRTAAGPQRIALLGSVATDPLARGRGHASRLLDVAVDDCMRAGAGAVLLWAERPELYARAGFEPGPEESCCALARGTATSDATVRLATVQDHAALTRLHAQKLLGVERSVHAMSGLLTTPGMWTCVLERRGNVVAYACCGKGADLQGWWHEVGGSDADVAALLPAAAALLELEQSFVLLPPYRPRLAALLGPRVETARVPGPMVCLLRGETLPQLWIDGLDSI